MSIYKKIKESCSHCFRNYYFFMKDGLLPLSSYVVDLKSINTPFFSNKRSQADIKHLTEEIPEIMRGYEKTDFIDVLEEAYKTNLECLKPQQIHVTSESIRVKKPIGQEKNSIRGFAGKIWHDFGYMATSRLDLVPLSFRLPGRDESALKGSRLPTDRKYRTGIERSLRVELPGKVIVGSDEIKILLDENTIGNVERLNEKLVVADAIFEMEPHILFSDHLGYFTDLAVFHEVGHLNMLIYLNWKANEMAKESGKSVDEIFLSFSNSQNPLENACTRISKLFSGLQALSMIEKYNGSDKERLVEILSKTYDFQEIEDLERGFELSTSLTAKHLAEARKMDVVDIAVAHPYLIKTHMAKIEEYAENGRQITKEMANECLPFSHVGAIVKSMGLPKKRHPLLRLEEKLFDIKEEIEKKLDIELCNKSVSKKLHHLNRVLELKDTYERSGLEKEISKRRRMLLGSYLTVSLGLYLANPALFAFGLMSGLPWCISKMCFNLSKSNREVESGRKI